MKSDSWRRWPVGYLYSVRDERWGAEEGALLLSVSQFLGVVPRSAITDKAGRADSLASYKICHPGDIVINRMSAYQGALGISAFSGVVSPDYLVIHPHRTVDPRFLSHLFKSSWFVGQMTARIRGIGSVEQGNVRTPRINPEDLSRIDVALPPLVTQRAISDYLDLETARIDSLIAAKQRMVQLLDERLAARASDILFHSSAYRAVRLKFICGIPTSGNRDHSNFTYTAEGVPCLRGIDLSGAYVDLSTVLRISPEDNLRHANTVLHTGDLVIVRSGATAGRSALVTEQLDGSNCVDLVVVRRSPELESSYLAYVVRSRETQSAVLQESSGALQPHFNAVHASEIMVPMRTLKEQQRLVAMLDAWRARKELLVEMMHDQTHLLRERRQSLITAIVTGERSILGVAA